MPILEETFEARVLSITFYYILGLLQVNRGLSNKWNPHWNRTEIFPEHIGITNFDFFLRNEGLLHDKNFMMRKTMAA